MPAVAERRAARLDRVVAAGPLEPLGPDAADRHPPEPLVAGLLQMQGRRPDRPAAQRRGVRVEQGHLLDALELEPGAAPLLPSASRPTSETQVSRVTSRRIGRDEPGDWASAAHPPARGPAVASRKTSQERGSSVVPVMSRGPFVPAGCRRRAEGALVHRYYPGMNVPHTGRAFPPEGPGASSETGNPDRRTRRGHRGPSLCGSKWHQVAPSGRFLKGPRRFPPAESDLAAKPDHGRRTTFHTDRPCLFGPTSDESRDRGEDAHKLRAATCPVRRRWLAGRTGAVPPGM